MLGYITHQAGLYDPPCRVVQLAMPGYKLIRGILISLSAGHEKLYGIKRNKIKTQMSSNVIFFYIRLVLKINFLV